MDRNRFNVEVRPGLTKISIGERGTAFDWFELDAWIYGHISIQGRKAHSLGASQWVGGKHRPSLKVQLSDASKNISTEDPFAKAPAQIVSTKPDNF